ncbi:hypothetical protein RJ41_13880 [Alteromonas marina]|uniref:Right handed beta helix domain-containing protein n=1 Tax=Alteromonas marina TaxID=203795 RepID=A0A0B3Z0N0_9ALTE|nr:hypothetical protein [Alteromonas marina]KHT50216.1 hypothetical protein RJ41_13880 [Alteromonas marina]
MRRSIILSCLLAAMPIAVSAKVINVNPGTNTLQTAINAAEAGDTLILSSGVYDVSLPSIRPDDDYFVINKPITLRAKSADDRPTLNVVRITDVNCSTEEGEQYSFLDGDIITLQGIITNADITINGCGMVISDSILRGSVKSTANPAVIIGNDIILDSQERMDANVVAYNNIRQNSGAVISAQHIVGNDINCFSAGSGICVQSNHPNAQSLNEGFIVGNSFQVETARYDSQTEGAGNNNFDKRYAINLNSVASTTVASNKIHFKIQDGDRPVENERVSALVAVGMAHVGLNTTASIYNNTIVYDASLPAPLNDSDAGAIYTIIGDATVRNNIIFGAHIPAISFNQDTAAQGYENIVVATHNICFGNVENCSESESNINADPQFVGDSFRVSETSPAKNGGYDALMLYDIDKTLPDIGVYGGPYGFEQYTNIRESEELPYIVPLFNEIAEETTDAVNVRVIAVPRLR